MCHCNVFSPGGHKTVGYTVYTQISITFMFAEHLNNRFWVNAGVCRGFGARNSNTEMPLSSPECYCNRRFTDDCFHSVLLADADGHLLEAATWMSYGQSSASPLLLLNSPAMFLWQPAVPRSSTNENGVGEGEETTRLMQFICKLALEAIS